MHIVVLSSTETAILEGSLEKLKELERQYNSIYVPIAQQMVCRLIADNQLFFCGLEHWDPLRYDIVITKYHSKKGSSDNIPVSLTMHPSVHDIASDSPNPLLVIRFHREPGNLLLFYLDGSNGTIDAFYAKLKARILGYYQGR